jgi:hypothetical protein
VLEEAPEASARAAASKASSRELWRSRRAGLSYGRLAREAEGEGRKEMQSAWRRRDEEGEERRGGRRRREEEKNNHIMVSKEEVLKLHDLQTKSKGLVFGC